MLPADQNELQLNINSIVITVVTISLAANGYFLKRVVEKLDDAFGKISALADRITKVEFMQDEDARQDRYQQERRRNPRKPRDGERDDG